MPQFDWDETSFWIDGKRQFLVSGEVQYFRVPQSDWETRLRLLKAASGNCVATYIPWILHAPTEGDIRFGDCPERDLEKFLTHCRELELFVICRPGPYQYAELKYDGLPGWLCENYPQILARNNQGEIFRGSSVSYLHPLFLEKVREWFSVVNPILSRYTISKGGPVAMVQVDNELMGIHEWFGGWDYNPETMGFGQVEGRYPQFLQQRYSDIRALNATYGSDYGQFIDVRPSDQAEIPDARVRRSKDYQDFYFETISEYVDTLSAWVREDGIDCQIVHNSANPNMDSYFLETVKRLGNSFFLGADHYYNLDQDWNQNNPTPQYAVNVFYSNEMLRLMGYPATIFELPGGSLSDWPPLTPEDLLSCYLANTALGMKGSNYYIFTGGPNPEGVSHYGDVYDYGASISATGEIRPTYAAQREFGKFLADHSWLAGSERVADFYFGLDWEQSRSRHYGKASDDRNFSNNDAWTFARKGILTTAFCSSLSGNFVDLDLPLPTDKPVVVATATCMSAARQMALVEFVRQGGSLVLAPVIPSLDENLQPCTILGDYLGAAGSSRLPQTSPVIAVDAVHNVLMNGSVWINESRPATAKRLAVEETTGAEIGWRLDTESGGTVIWLGLHWKHSKHEHAQMLTNLLGQLGCQTPVVICDNPNVWTSLRSDGERFMLFVMNLLSAPMTAEVRVRARAGEDEACFSLSLKAMEVLALPVD